LYTRAVLLPAIPGSWSGAGRRPVRSARKPDRSGHESHRHRNPTGCPT
jgi:hypothetical protein